jgi:hypothetical protein
LEAVGPLWVLVMPNPDDERPSTLTGVVDAPSERPLLTEAGVSWCLMNTQRELRPDLAIFDALWTLIWPLYANIAPYIPSPRGSDGLWVMWGLRGDVRKAEMGLFPVASDPFVLKSSQLG